MGVGWSMTDVPDTCEAANKWHMSLGCKTTMLTFSLAYKQGTFNVHLVKLKRHKTVLPMFGSLKSVSLLFLLILMWREITIVFTP